MAPPSPHAPRRAAAAPELIRRAIRPLPHRRRTCTCATGCAQPTRRWQRHPAQRSPTASC
eukprot:1614880-Prymnesium_polylepis.2